MKKRIIAIAAPVLLLAALLAAPLQVLAASDAIHSIDISVQLFDDGSARFTEVWDISVNDPDSTEWYVTKYNLDGMAISDFTVTDEDGYTFRDVGAWDTGLSREEKAYTSGLVETMAATSCAGASVSRATTPTPSPIP